MKTHRIVELLPDVVQRTVTPGSVTESLLQVMEDLQEPVESVLADIGLYLDPYRCPSSFVPMLAHWVGYGWLIPDSDDYVTSIAEGPLRNLVRHAATLAKDRGTRGGLLKTLELATGQTGFAISGSPRTPFGIDIRCPESARPSGGLIKRIVSHDKPAFTVAFLGIGDDQLLPLASFFEEEAEPVGATDA